MDVSAIVLAGGKNLRLGRSKALENIDGKSLIERVIERLRPLTDQILIVTSREKYDLPDVGEADILFDLYPEMGPLGGIYTGLLEAQFENSIVVACDMPFLNTDLLRYMVEQAGDFDAVVPRLGEGMVEPLHAVYSQSCRGKMKERLESNRLGVHSFIHDICVRYVERVEYERFDPQLLSFFNVNYPSDLERAITLMAEGRQVK